MSKSTSWQAVGGWYKKAVGVAGNYYHQELIIPGVLRLLDLKPGESLLDLGCGQGVLGRAIPKDVHYLGIDLAANLIEEAQRLDKNLKHKYVVGDATKELGVTNFDKGAIVLALQNMENAKGAIRNLSKINKSVIVINHPCFRIPRQSEWGYDDKNRTQYRRINGYMSEQKIPMLAEPSKGGNSSLTWSFHWPISMISEWLTSNNLVISRIEEWVSNKKSTGSKAKIEDRAREEFPLFMALVVEGR